MKVLNQILKPFQPVVDTCVKKPLRTLANTKLMDKHNAHYISDVITYMTGVSIASAVLKDALGGVLYYRASKNNKDIDKDKRDFIANLDLVNCGLMIVTQIVLGLTISHKSVQKKLFNSVFKRSFGKKASENILNKLQQNETYAKLNKRNRNNVFDGLKDNCSKTFNTFTSLVVATLAGKRTIVPIVATFWAGKMQKKSLDQKTRNSPEIRNWQPIYSKSLIDQKSCQRLNVNPRTTSPKTKIEQNPTSQYVARRPCTFNLYKYF